MAYQAIAGSVGQFHAAVTAGAGQTVVRPNTVAQQQAYVPPPTPAGSMISDQSGGSSRVFVTTASGPVDITNLSPEDRIGAQAAAQQGIQQAQMQAAINQGLPMSSIGTGLGTVGSGIPLWLILGAGVLGLVGYMYASKKAKKTSQSSPK